MDVDPMPQENGLSVFERCRKRPILQFNEKQPVSKLVASGENRCQIIQIVGPPSSGKTLTALKLLEAALESDKESQVLILDCDSDINCKKLHQVFKMHQLKRLHFYKVFNLDEYLIWMGMLPQLLCELPMVNLLLIDGLSDPFLLRDQQEHIDQHLSRQVGRLATLMKAFPGVACLVTTRRRMRQESDLEITMSRENNKCMARRVTQNMSNDEAIVVNNE